jgi:hypothetical protein
LIENPAAAALAPMASVGSTTALEAAASYGSNDAAGTDGAVLLIGESLVLAPGAVSPAGVWHHLVVRVTPDPSGQGSVDLFVDNVKTTTHAFIILDDLTLDTIGVNALFTNGADDGTYWNGSIQHVAFWNTALQDHTIGTIFDATDL